MSKDKWRLLGLKVKISLSSAGKVLLQPGYFTVAFASAFVIAGFLLWSLNLSLVRYIVFDAPLGVWGKLDFVFSAYRSVFTTYDTVAGLGIMVFSLLFGINAALIIFVIKNQGFKHIPKKSGLGGLGLAIVGGGCIACGTSIVAPLLATFGAASSSLLQELSALFSWLGSLLIIYSVYELGQVISYIKSEQTLD